ncbi:MAG: TrkH family potassium uptake protein, partial [Victivallales bacterium]|nr:TrkH family potassium uptake protein [Victivallales bacterium]
MNSRAIGQVISPLLGIIGGAMLVTALVSIGMGDRPCVPITFVLCSLFSFVLTLVGWMLSRRRLGESELTTGVREGFGAVGFGWLVVTLVAAIPFWAVLDLAFFDCIFETASGLTTTGASIFASGMRIYGKIDPRPDVLEHLPYGILFWRAVLNWLGGVGIVFFVLLILPLMKVGQNKMFYNAEVPGLKMDDDQMAPRLSTSVKMVLGVYGALTISSILLYHFFGMEWFDAVCHSFSTVSTGGFSPKANSLAF